MDVSPCATAMEFSCRACSRDPEVEHALSGARFPGRRGFVIPLRVVGARRCRVWSGISRKPACGGEARRTKSRGENPEKAAHRAAGRKPGSPANDECRPRHGRAAAFSRIEPRSGEHRSPRLRRVAGAAPRHGAEGGGALCALRVLCVRTNSAVSANSACESTLLPPRVKCAVSGFREM